MKSTSCETRDDEGGRGVDSPSSNSSLTAELDRLGEGQRTGFMFEQKTGFGVTGYDDIRQGKNLTNAFVL